MSDDDDLALGIYEQRNNRIGAAADARAKIIRDNARMCAACGKPMLGWPGRSLHFTCDPQYPLAGLRCTCPVGCSNTHWGNGAVDCDPSCEPCKIMRGKPLSGRKKG